MEDYINIGLFQERIKILNKRLNLNKIPRNKLKEMKVLYHGNYKILMKEIEDDTNRYFLLGIRIINIDEGSVLPKSVYTD